jgi:hypothetical protein
MSKAASRHGFGHCYVAPGFSLMTNHSTRLALPPPSFVGVDRSSFIRHKSPAITSFLLYSERGK